MKPIACWFGRHAWEAKVTRDVDVMTVLCACTECGKWWSSSCLSVYGGDYEAIGSHCWHGGDRAAAAAIYGRARVLGEIVDLRKKEPKP
ncbi:MAG: hypothetical protein RJA36_2974 [Pseudomonadota bacterium]|jgi:hypothetical protein